MILQIRNSRISKFGSIFMILIFIGTLNPLGSYALTGGPAQPEFNSFTPIGTSDMVDLASGDFSYNIPLMDVGGFPINLAYNSGVTMDQEASWVGLGWDLSIGQINRQMRGLPDDFDGDEVVYENNIKDNWTVGATFQGSPELFGFAPLDINVGISGKYNSYSGYSFSPTAGISYEIAGAATVGVQAESTPDGLVLQPSLSLSNKKNAQDGADKRVGQASISASFNSRQGLSNLNLSASTNRPTQNMSKKLKNVSGGAMGSSISLVPNTYTPSVQANMLNLHGTANFAVDGTFFGVKIEAEQTGFGSIQFIDNKVDSRPVYGFENTQKAPEKAVLDFNREKDGVFSKNSSNLPLTNYTYDIYNVQGQGVSGMFHPYRSQIGYVYDDKMVSNSGGTSGGGEIGGGWTVDVGIDIEANYSRNRTGLWKLTNKVWNNGEGVFEEAKYPELPETPDYEEVYFKNVGDLSADPNHDMYDYDGVLGGKLGGYNPVRLKFDGLPYARTLQSDYEIKTGLGYANYEINKNDIKRSERVKRNQAILKVTNKEAEMLKSETFDVNELYGKGYHTAGFIVTRNDGARYNYGKALYNTEKREVTFALGKPIGGATSSESIGIGNNSSGLVSYAAGIDNSLDNKKGDHYFNRITTPDYGHTFLLTSLISSDYSDRDGIEGPSVDDFGSYTLFTYRNMGALYQWRVPYLANKANYNEGLKTDPTDDKGSYVYGEKELTYIKKIETKTHIAIFHISARHDAHGVLGENGGRNDAADMHQLDRIELFSRAEYENATTTNDDETAANIITDAIPIKTVHFEYKYSLCQGVPNNDEGFYDGDGDGVNDNLGGKLTLSKVYFTYRNSGMGKYSAYDFRYADEDHNWPESDADAVDDEDGRNPVYGLKGYDIWGGYKKNTDALTEGEGTNPVSALTAPEFNYVEQNDGNANDYAAAWSLSDISLPSGGQIQIDYESDDYQYVQDKKAMRMFKLAGAGKTKNPNIPAENDFLFDPVNNLNAQENKEALLFKGPNSEAEYLYFELDGQDQDGSLTPAMYREKYLSKLYDEQKGLLQFRMLMNMTPKGGVNKSSWKDHPFDYVSGYCELKEDIDSADIFEWGGIWYGSVPLKTVKIEGGIGGSLDYVNPISKAGWQFARRYLSQYVYGMPMLEDGTPIGAALESIAQAMENVAESVVGANKVLRDKRIARRFIPEKSWIRLSEPTAHKKGGGCRVKQIAMTDEWEQMSGSDEGLYLGQKYGQEYTYELKDGGSSGVATYEPVGSKENPLVQPVFVNVNRLLAPDEENYIEKPFGESFFPNPQVTYSRVSVKNLERFEDNGTLDTIDDERVTKHATGHVVTEFFTSKDYPTITDQTELHLEEDANPLLAAVFSLNVMKHLTLSQGYVVHNNDMNGKMKNQWVYGEGQDEPISGVEYVYDQSTPDDPSPSLGNKGRLDNSVLTLDPNGNVELGMIGVEQSIINDFREMKSSTQVAGVDFQTNTFTLGPVTLVVPTPFPKYSRHVTRVKIAATTKVINTFGILRETIAHDAGAKVSTRNKLWDSETGEVLLTETVNEYDDHYYSFNFPAHWGYERMGQAAFNSGLELPLTPLGGGDYSIDTDGDANDYLALGDEVLLKAAIPEGYVRGWVTGTDGVNFHLINAAGVALHEGSSTRLKVIRSGRRNLQSTSMGSIVMQKVPAVLLEAGGTFNTNTHLKVDGTVGNTWDDRRIVNAGAVEFRENWDLQCECGIDPLNDTYNPYRYNMLGVWRANKSHLYLTGRAHDADGINPRSDGFYKNYSSFYANASGNWLIDETNWTFTSEVTSYSPYGFELENADALGRYSAAQYGYNFSFPLAVGANSEYSEMGFDGFEDYHFDGCLENEHFGFRDNLTPGDFEPESGVGITKAKSHTGRFSLRVPAGENMENTYRIDCDE